jgi:hypothetical protein
MLEMHDDEDALTYSDYDSDGVTMKKMTKMGKIFSEIPPNCSNRKVTSFHISASLHLH